MSDTEVAAKAELRARLIAQLEAEMSALIARAERTRQEATHEEAKPESDKDTRALEQSYLARGQALRVEELAEAIATLKFVELKARTQVALGARVDVEILEDGDSKDGDLKDGDLKEGGDPKEDEVRRFFLLPVVGGAVIDTDRGDSVQVITPASPLGRALLGAEEGEERALRLKIAGKLRERVCLVLKVA